MTAAATRVSAEQYERLALAEPDRFWELHDGLLVEKPVTTIDHNRAMRRLRRRLDLQLDPSQHEVEANVARVRRGNASYFIPDLLVIPTVLADALPRGVGALEVYTDPLPLVVEAWSPSTGGYDLTSKLPEYQRRGDREVWHLHPNDRTLTAWRRERDGRYSESLHRGGTIEPVALPGVTIDLDALFV